jgi:hypothetical protein
LNRNRAIEIAKEAAKKQPEKYYSEPFVPHEWVITAILAAVKESGGKITDDLEAVEEGRVPWKSDFKW